VLEGLEIAAWQAIDVPRILDDPDHDPDPGPDEELAAMFGRTQAALSGWMQALDRRNLSTTMRQRWFEFSEPPRRRSTPAWVD
jgi:hypothetical protein